jgi:phospholipase/carboxylesterase
VRRDIKVKKKMSFSLKTTEINGDSSTAIVLLHGYGAHRHDLAPLAQVIPLESSPSWIFPDAPFSPAELALFGGRSWFDLDMAQLQIRAANPEAPLYDATHVNRLRKTTDEILSPFLWSLTEKYPSIVLGGFSQGAMMCLDWAWRHCDSSLKGLLLLSGAWPYLEDPSECRIPPGLPIFVSHGSADAILRPLHSERMTRRLEQRGANVESVLFQGGHEIPPQVIARATKFLNNTLRV